MEIQGWYAFADEYKPIRNHFKNDEIMFETYGEEVEYVRNYDHRYVWTLVSGDMCDLVVAGYSYVNRLGYYITELPWEDEDTTVLLSIEEECECYDENNEDGGDPECKLCDGYGLITRYVG